MIAAIYARKSTEQNGINEEGKSVTRQVEHATAYATKKGWSVSEEYVFVDDGVSGAEFAKRPGFLRLMNALKPKPPFQVLIMSEESRLGREAIETAYALKQLVTAGVRVFFYLEDKERVLESPTDKIMLSLTAFADELEREKARQRTHDAMIRIARSGHVTGGLVYGYDNHEVASATKDSQGRVKRAYVERRINESQAAVVRRIFKDCADGKGFINIGKALNADGVPTPRITSRLGNGWAPSSVREILYRDLYRGIIIWNRTKKRNRWGQKQSAARPESEWVRVEAPDGLRIVPDKLWKDAHDRLDRTRATYLRGTKGQLWGRPATGLESKYLLTGLSLCGQCGGSLYVRSRSHGNRRMLFYGCTSYNLRGRAVCTNNMELPLEEANASVLRQIERDVLHPDVVMEAVRQAVERLRPSQGELEAKRKALVAEIETIDAERARLADAIAAGGNLPALLDAVRERERQKQRLTRSLDDLTGMRQIGQVDHRRLEKDLRARLVNWQGLLQQHVPQARQILKRLLAGRLVFTPISKPRSEMVGASVKAGPAGVPAFPRTNGVERLCEFKGESQIGKILEGLVVTKALVSPTGFEPVLPA